MILEKKRGNIGNRGVSGRRKEESINKRTKQIVWRGGKRRYGRGPGSTSY